MAPRRRRTREVLELVDLWDVRGRRAGQLSGGMQRRLELACALVHEPALLFLDEPTAGIDPLLRGRIWDELHRLRDEGRTLLVTTQYVSEAEECDQVALIAGGRLIALATPDELRRLATGGDVLEIETAALFDGTALAELPVVRAGPPGRAAPPPRHRRRRRRPRTPDVVEPINARGGEVAYAREIRATFDEVFAILVARDQATRAAVGGAEATADGADDRRTRPTPTTSHRPTDRAGGRRMRALGSRS